LNFFIYSLPRSGSTWLSVFLTGHDSFCYHDPFGDERIVPRTEKVVGAVDTGAYRMTPIVDALYPEARRFVLYRDIEQIQASTDRHGVKFNAAEEMKILDAIEVPRIYSSMFGDLEYLEILWKAIIGLPFDAERARMLSEMRIDTDVRKYFAHRPYLNPVARG